jgi:hypothetical protein
MLCLRAALVGWQVVFNSRRSADKGRQQRIDTYEIRWSGIFGGILRFFAK